MPTHKEKLYKEFEESLLHLAMESYAEQEGRRLIAEAEKLRENPSAPKPRSEWVNELERMTVRRMKKGKLAVGKQKGFWYQKLTKKVLLVAVILLTFLCASLTVSSEFRGFVFDWLIVQGEKYSLFAPQNPNSLVTAPHSTLGTGAYFAPTLLPKGFRETDASGTSLAWINSYGREDGEFIEFYQSKSLKISSIKGNSENAEYYEDFYISEGVPAVLYINNGITTIFWEQNGSVLRIKSGLDFEIVKQVAKNVEIIN